MFTAYLQNENKHFNVRGNGYICVLSFDLQHGLLKTEISELKISECAHFIIYKISIFQRLKLKKRQL